jgi:hypothetical protein
METDLAATHARSRSVSMLGSASASGHFLTKSKEKKEKKSLHHVAFRGVVGYLVVN